MQSDQPMKNKPTTLTDQMRVLLKNIADPIGAFLNRMGIHPNTLTLAGLAGNLIAALFLSRGNFLIGGLIALAMGPVDGLDGTMARLRGEPTSFGAFVDSVSDRYSELLIFGGLMAHYLMTDEPYMVGLIFIAACGSVLVSYHRARVEGLGFEAKVGILTRMERFVILIPSLILGIPRIGIGIVAIFANITALQRVFFVRKQAVKREGE
jgi:CDP-diacylglycerol--glycerol-3-phosphate 3-phosphatidyltransferase